MYTRNSRNKYVRRRRRKKKEKKKSGGEGREKK
jgi:hypothetical protein